MTVTATQTRPSVFPVFHYKDARVAMDWLVRAFGFEKHSEVAAPDGSIAHAELRFGVDTIGIGSVQPPEPAKPWTLVREVVYVVVTDVDAHHDRAKAAGAEIAMPLTDQPYGSRDYAARDLDGRLWGFGTYSMSGGAGESNMFVGVHYRNLREALVWLDRAFGFEKTFEVPGPDGRVEHAEMRFGGSIIMVEQTPPENSAWGRNSLATFFYVADPDAHYVRAAAAGATIVYPPQNKPWARDYYARDLEGFLWGFSTYKPRS